MGPRVKKLNLFTVLTCKKNAFQRSISYLLISIRFFFLFIRLYGYFLFLIQILLSKFIYCLLHLKLIFDKIKIDLLLILSHFLMDQKQKHNSFAVVSHLIGFFFNFPAFLRLTILCMKSSLFWMYMTNSKVLRIKKTFK